MAEHRKKLTIQQAIELAMQHHGQGHLSQAETIYQQILQTDPSQPVALHLLGVIAHQVGKYEKAVDLITKALANNPTVADAHNNLGLAFHHLGKFDDALASYRNALAIRPRFAEAFYNQGNTFREVGSLEEALTSYGKALAIKSDYAKVHNNLGNTHRDLNEFDQATTSYQTALNIQPSYAEAHNNLGLVLRDIGKLEDAVTSFQKALAIKPQYVDATIHLGTVLQELDRPTEAFTCHRRAIFLNPQNKLAWSNFGRSLERISFFTSVDDGLYQDLLQLLDQETVGPSYIAKPIITALHHHPDFRPIVEELGSKESRIEATYRDFAEKLSAIPLLLRIMELSPINDLEVERVLTVLRCGMIREITGRDAEKKVAAFSVALALNCYTNDYVFPETEEEKDVVDHLQRQVNTLVEKERAVPPSMVVAIGAYRPLFSFPWAEKLPEQKWTDDVMRVIRRQITEPLEERRLRDRIPCTTLIQNSISQSVREQYEENPYPRWTKTDIHYRGRTIGNVLKAPPLRFDLGDYKSPEKPKILIAGCGTGRHALYTASRYLNAQVLAMDLSLSSLSYAKRKTDELGLSNIEYVQGDITELDSLGQQFDLIECVGVLHHLDDPLSGWQILVNFLHPTGFMNIGLYSEFARQDVVRARSVIAEKGYRSLPADIRKCRQDIIAMAANGNRAMARICNERLFFNASECRDFLFHVQEHQFTLTKIEKALQSMNLNFLGFEMQDQRILREFRKLHPNNDPSTSLPLWHKFELEHPDTFRGMYQFWCKKI